MLLTNARNLHARVWGRVAVFTSRFSLFLNLKPHTSKLKMEGSGEGPAPAGR